MNAPKIVNPEKLIKFVVDCNDQTGILEGDQIQLPFSARVLRNNEYLRAATFEEINNFWRARFAVSEQLGQQYEEKGYTGD